MIGSRKRESSWRTHCFSLLFTILLLCHRAVLAAFQQPPSRRPLFVDRRSALFVSSKADVSREIIPRVEQPIPPGHEWLIHWKGEAEEGYSMSFRHVEFRGALRAVLGDEDSVQVRFEDALNYTGSAIVNPVKLSGYNSAMQYASFSDDISREAVQRVAQRCSLIHDVYEIVAEATTEDDASSTYEKLGAMALERGGFDDMRENHTWCFRLRHYGRNNGDEAKERRYGARSRSIARERQALHALKPLLLTFGGKVDLENPDCKIYIFDGLREGQSVVARRLAMGPRVSVIDPNTRICVTNTPLCPIAAFSLCNVAGIRPNDTILDPFAGSCATLLAAAMIEPTCRSVGIEIAHNGLVNRDDIRRDFASRNLVEPAALLQGDSNDAAVRAQARAAIGNRPFDYIVTDPPYGIRESKASLTTGQRPIDELLCMISKDREAGTPLLKEGCRLVCFLPCECRKEKLQDIMPSEEQSQQAGLRFELAREQPLNDSLSRWLVSFVCTGE